MASAGTSTGYISIPAVVQFGFENYIVTDNRQTAKCKSCGVSIAEKKGTTSSYTRHLKGKHPELHALYEGLKSQASSGGNHAVRTFFTQPDPTYDVSHPRQKLLCKSLVENLIVKGGLPIALVENEGFRKFLMDVDPFFVAPSCQSVMNTYLPYLLTEKHVAVAEALSCAADVALVINVWVDGRQQSFTAITANFLNIDTGKLMSLLIKFRSLKGLLTGESIATIINNVLTEYNLQDKVHYVVIDKASNVKKALSFGFATGPSGDVESWLVTGLESEANVSVKENDMLLDDSSFYEDLPFGEVESYLSVFGEHFPCFAHSLQLTVQDGMNNVLISCAAVAKCARITNLIHQGGVFRSIFEEMFGEIKFVPHCTDARWNSVFRQIDYVCSLDSGLLSVMLKKSSQEHLMLSEMETHQLRELVDILEPFVQATDWVEGSACVSVSCVVPLVLTFHHKLMQQLSVVKFQQSLVRELLNSLFDRFWGIFAQLQISPPDFFPLSLQHESHHYNSSVYLFACTLDPQHAYRWMDLHPGTDGAKGVLKNIIFDELVEMLNNSGQFAVLDGLGSGHTSAAEAAASSCMEPTSKKLCTSLFGYKRPSLQTTVTASPESQLASYLAAINHDSFEADENMNIFRKMEYNLLRPLFTRFFCIPASSAPVERIFAHGGIMLKPQRAKMEDEVLEMLMFLRCNKN